MEKKYELLMEDEFTLHHHNPHSGEPVTLHRIRALKDFNRVKSGDIGGYVQSYDNLSQIGICWIYDNVKVYENASVLANACAYEEAEIFGEASVLGNASIRERSIICDYANVHGQARISGNVQI